MWQMTFLIAKVDFAMEFTAISKKTNWKMR